MNVLSLQEKMLMLILSAAAYGLFENSVWWCVELFWTAPENLRRVLRGERRHYTQPADIYSVGVVLKEILCKNTAYEEEVHMLDMTPRGQLLTHYLDSGEEAVVL